MIIGTRKTSATAEINLERFWFESANAIASANRTNVQILLSKTGEVSKFCRFLEKYKNMLDATKNASLIDTSTATGMMPSLLKK
jgi:hypothetical protein